jgi:WD40 repeat protein
MMAVASTVSKLRKWYPTVAFSHDGRTVLTGHRDNIARLWDTATGRSRGILLHHRGPVSAVAFSPDSRTILTGSNDKTARLWDAATGRPIGPPLPHPAEVDNVAFSPDGRTALTTSRDGFARLWALPAPVPGPVDRVVLWTQVITGMELAPDGEARVLDTQTWSRLHQRLMGLGGLRMP